MKRFLLTLTVLIATGQTFAQNWSLVWADEFNGTSLNLADWNYDLGTGSQYGLWGWGNGELQYYREENVEVTGGNLVITALQENYMGQNYTSGKIHTKTKRFYTHGKIEARMQVPTDQGMWPAFWMLTEPGDLSQNSAGWPPELDIMETVGHSGNTAFATAHYGTWPTVISNGGNYTVPSGDLSSAFHTYTVEWYPDNIAWYFDGILIHELNAIDVSPEAWQFNQDFFLIFNLAVGGTWPGDPDGSTTFPEQMLVDWVRVYSYDDTETTDVTFRVDMSEQTLAPTDIVHVNGTWNAWCGACNPMTDMGNGIWEVTLPIPPGVHEYKFTTNGWGGLIEDFPGGESCTLTTFDGVNTFVNRVLNVQFDPIDLAAVCFDSCEVCPGSVTDGCTDSTAANYNPFAITDDGSCVYNVTFSVDMNEYGGAFTNPEVHADFNGWCLGCNPMTDGNGDDVWEATIQLPIGSYQFLYSTDNLADLEDFSPTDPCVVGGEPFVNRELIITGATVLPTNCWNSCSACATNPGCLDSDASNYDSTATSDDGSCMYDFTFSVDMNCESGFTTVYAVGPFNTWCANCHPLTDADMDGVWTGTYAFAPQSLEYKYQVDEWASQEDLVDDMVGGATCAPVTDYFNYANRLVDIIDSPVVVDDTYGTCGTCVPGVNGCMDTGANNYDSTATIDDGSCTYDVIFTVDMNVYGNAGVDYTTPEVNGSFNGWCGACAPMVDPEMDGVWTLTISLAAGSYEYKFAVDNWTDQEYPDPSEPCMLGANRQINVTSALDIGVVCWGSCLLCPLSGCTDPAFIEFNPYAEIDDGSCATPVVYGCLYSAATNFDSTANIDDGSCAFDCANPCPGDFDGNLTINTGDLLAFLTFFGTSCN